jgi:hypothetical protein
LFNHAAHAYDVLAGIQMEDADLLGEGSGNVLDFIASVCDHSGKTTAELCTLLLKIIADSKQSAAASSSPCQS